VCVCVCVCVLGFRYLENTAVATQNRAKPPPLFPGLGFRV
jgi:hypothetical protein